MKLFVIVALFCAIAGVKAIPSCEVAAVCKYEDGTMMKEFRNLPPFKVKAKKEPKEPKKPKEPREPKKPKEPKEPKKPCCKDSGWWDGPDDRQYQVTERMAEWDEAESECEKIGGHVIQYGAKHQSAYDKIVKDYLEVYHSRIYGVWLALSKVDGEFVWSNGDPMTAEQKENWSGDFDGSDNCVFVRHYDDYSWEDTPCTWLYSVLCERMKECEICTK